MADITWEAPLCAEESSCFRLGTDADGNANGNAYIAVAGAEDHDLTDTHDALRALIAEIKSGKADHLR